MKLQGVVFEYLPSALAALVFAGAAWLYWRSTPARVVSQAQSAREAAEAIEADFARIRREWQGWTAGAEALLEEISAASEQLGRRRRKVRVEADRAERANGALEPLDPVEMKRQQLRAAGFPV